MIMRSSNGLPRTKKIQEAHHTHTCLTADEKLESGSIDETSSRGQELFLPRLRVVNGHRDSDSSAEVAALKRSNDFRAAKS